MREELDELYAKLQGAMIASVEKIAATDSKHGDRLRLENYTFLESGVGSLGRQSTQLEAIRHLAQTRAQAALQVYVQQQLEYCKLWRILELSIRLDSCLKDVAPDEIQFQPGLSPNDVSALVRDCMDRTDVKLTRMFDRVKKHLVQDAPSLIHTVWTSCQNELLQRYVRLEELMFVVYPNIPLTPTPEEVKELFKVTGPGN